MDNSGSGLQWEDDVEGGGMVCPVHLRHFSSGRLLQITHVVKGGKLSYKITLQDSGDRSIENDVLLEDEPNHPGKLQNYVFNLYSRSIISENSRTLSRDTVCNIGNKT